MSISETFEEMFRKRFGRPPTREELTVLVDQSVTSFNQSGGITAHTVNVGPTPRSLDAAFKASILSMLPKDRLIKVDTPIGDGEAIQFGTALWEYLVAQGYNMSPGGMSQSITIPAPKGQSIDLHSEQGVAKVIVGHR